MIHSNNVQLRKDFTSGLGANLLKQLCKT